MSLERAIAAAYEAGGALSSEAREAVREALALLDSGALRVAEKTASGWRVHNWLKQAILLSFRFYEMAPHEAGPLRWRDKMPLKEPAGFRAVPGSVIRYGSYLAPGCVVMPAFINIGAHIGGKTMIDSWATVGSCAQIGQKVHISGGAGIGGVLEPLQAKPVIIEDGCFIGARSEVAEGVIIEEGAVLAMGVFITASTKIIDRASGEVLRGRVPAYSVVVPGSIADGKTGLSLYCAVIVKRVDAQTRSKTSINDLLRL